MSSANGQSIVEEVPLQPLVAKVANESALEARIRPISGDDVLSPKPSAASVRPAISCTSLNEDRVNRTSKSRPQFLSKYKNRLRMASITAFERVLARGFSRE